MKYKRAYSITCLWLILLAATACSRQKQDEVVPVGSSAAMAGNWVLIDPASAYAITLRIGDTGQAAFTEYYGVQFTGRASVNTYAATASFSMRPSIESGATGTGYVQGLSATKMAGSPEAMRFEQDYFARLGAVNLAELVGTDRLRLSYSGATPGVLVYKRQ